ncbi:MAG: hypothetical protein HZB65_00695 [Candidatus Aenigmarchaeota archaeon]|nr:hypothetical protein [Candidatus Aenigmarchaeota archaeon]
MTENADRNYFIEQIEKLYNAMNNKEVLEVIKIYSDLVKRKHTSYSRLCPKEQLNKIYTSMMQLITESMTVAENEQKAYKTDLESVTREYNISNTRYDALLQEHGDCIHEQKKLEAEKEKYKSEMNELTTKQKKLEAEKAELENTMRKYIDKYIANRLNDSVGRIKTGYKRMLAAGLIITSLLTGALYNENVKRNAEYRSDTTQLMDDIEILKGVIESGKTVPLKGLENAKRERLSERIKQTKENQKYQDIFAIF